jgi:hypothetical protein
VIWIEGYSGSLGIALPAPILAPRRTPRQNYNSPLAARTGSLTRCSDFFTPPCGIS